MATLIMAFLVGCAAPQKRQIVLKNKFNAEEVAWAKEVGSGKIVGSGLIQTIGGIPRSCAGNIVTINPSSPYSRERIMAIYGNEERGFIRGINYEIEVPPGYEDQFRKTRCDAQGAFEFDELPAGEYFVLTSVVWKVNDYSNEGGTMIQKVVVQEGKTKRIVLTP